MARAGNGADPVAEMLWGFQDRLSERLDILLQWGAEQACRLPECELGLTRTPLGYKLVATFMGGPPLGEAAANEQGLVVRGQRVLKRGTSHEVQRFALHTARYGVRGGPAYDDGPLRWYPVPLDGSLRMAVPDGELRITPLGQGADASGTPEARCLLTFEDARRIYALTLDTSAALQAEGVGLWQRQKVRRALQIRLNSKSVDLRSAGLPGVLGYHAVAERTFIVLAWVGGEIGLYYLDGYEFTLLARLEMWDLRHGGPLDVEGLMRARADRGVANEGPTVFTEEPAADMPRAGAEESAEEHGPPCLATAEAELLAAAPVTPPEHRELCLRHLTRLRDRLVGRGARKARQLVSLLLAALEVCRTDLVGSRTEVHVALEGVLAKAMPGGNRNIRDCLDLLCRESPLFQKDGNRCAVLFAQLHDAESPLSRRVAALESEPEKRPWQPDAGPVSMPTEPLPYEGAEPEAPPEPLSEGDMAQSTTITACSSPDATSGSSYTWVTDVSAFRVLGLKHPEPTVVDFEAPTEEAPVDPAPGASNRSAPSPHAPIAAFAKPWRPLFDDPDDPFDPEVETIHSASRMFLISRQKPPK